MHKETKWAKQIIALQDDEGKWGWFHSLSQYYDSPMTTEQALRRLERLGYTIEDACIQKAVHYMNDCLIGAKSICDRREKSHNWDIFTSMMLATWIRRFTHDNPAANRVAEQWKSIITSAFSSGVYNHEAYVSAYGAVFGEQPYGGRIIDFVQFYLISLTSDVLDDKTENAVMDYVLNHESGIYYIYSAKIGELPQEFASKTASYYLGAIELLAKYKHAKHKLAFVVNWLNSNRNKNGKWDMGKSVNDKNYFPLSNDWRKSETREADCTERISRLIREITR